MGEENRLEIRLFGPFAVLLNGEPLHQLKQHHNQAALLALLCLHADQSLKKEWVLQQLWPGEGRGMNNLNRLVQEVEEALEPCGITLSPAGGSLRLESGGVHVDVIAFDRAWRERETDPEKLSSRLDLCSGPLLQDWEHWYAPEWAAGARSRYAHRHREAVRWLAQRAIRDRDFEEAGRRLRSVRDQGDAAEAVHALMMRALFEASRYVEAAQFFEEYAAYLKETRRQAPPVEMIELYQRIPRATEEFTAAPEQVVLEPVGGSVALSSRFYVARQSDGTAHAAVKRRDSTLLIEGPRQTGKTSLLARCLEQARQEAASVVVTDFQTLDPEDMALSKSFLMALARQFRQQLDLKVCPSEACDPGLAPSVNFKNYIRDEALGRSAAPLVWGIDEADRIFDREYRDSVFGLFRSFHNARDLEPRGPWQRLTLIMSYAAEARLLISNLNNSPFNVGTKVALRDFDADQVADLNERYGRLLRGAGELDRLMRLVGGQPYLVRRSLYEMKAQGIGIDEIEREALREGSIFSDHLARLRKIVGHEEANVRVVKAVLAGEPVADVDRFSLLRSAGILAGDSTADARFRCGIYEDYLRKRVS